MKKLLFLILFLITSQLFPQTLTPTLPISLRTGAYVSGAAYYLPNANSTINTKYYEVTAGDILTVEAVVTHPDTKQYTSIKIFSYDSDVVTIGKTQGSLWAVNGASSKCYYSIVVAEGVSLLTVEIAKSSLSPSIIGEQIVHSFTVYKGLTIPAVASRASFSGTFSVSENGEYSKDGAPLFIWGIYPDGTRDYSDYKAQGFNAIVGNYPGSTNLAKAKAAGMYDMPNLAPFIISTNPLYADTANFRARLEGMVADKSSLLSLYWDDEQWAEYDVPKEILRIAREVLPLTPVIANFGNWGMARMWRDEVNAVMTYGNEANITQTFEIINNMDDDDNTIPGSIVVITVFDDALSAAELRTKVLRAVNAGARGVALFKDGAPSDFPDIANPDITTFRIWDSLPALMTEVAELVAEPRLLSAAILNTTTVEVNFSKAVIETDAENVNNYFINNGITVSAAVLKSPTKAKLTTSEHASGSYTVNVVNLKDLAGNTISSSNNTAAYSFNQDNEAPQLVSVKINNATTVTVNFSEAINKADAEAINNYIINNGISVTEAVLSDTSKVTLTTSEHSNGTYNLVVSNVKDLANNVISSNNTLSYSFAPKTPGPELLFAFAPHSNIVEVAFSKSVSQSTAENIQNYSISDEINIINVTLKSSSDAVSLEVSELVAEFHYTLTVDNIEDLEGNIISADSNTTVFCYLNNPGPIALYDFTEGLNSNLIYDISCNGAPLHLTISNPAAIIWLEGGGMSVNSNVIISSDIASKLNNNCNQTNELTIEAWIKPANTTQNGPARIVSLSNDAFNRNFTLGQGEGTNNTYGYDVRLRTTSTDNNGFPSITASAPALTTNLTHVVYTRSSEGVTKIYIDGVESLSTNLGGNLSNWDNSFKLILANEMTGDRPWLGEFHKVAIYDRALDQEEVANTFTEFNTTIHTNLMVVLEGPYNSGDMATDLLNQQIIPLDQPYSTEPWNYDSYELVAEIPNDIVDWILLELRSNDSTVIAKRAAFLRKDGKVVELNGISNVAFEGLASDEYFISVIHRNHLPVISSEKVVLGKHSQLLDLTKSENVFGEESTADLGNGVYGMYAGDTNCSSIITYSDAIGIVQKNTKSGYNIADVNLSGIVTYADVAHVINNNTKSAIFRIN